jgi:hypothetical protein
VVLLPPESPEDETFVLVLGDPPKQKAEIDWDLIDIEQDFYDLSMETDEGAEININGIAKLTFSLNAGLDYNWGIQGIKIIPRVRSEETLKAEIDMNAPLVGSEKEYRRTLTTIPLGTQVFFVGPVPVIVQYGIDVNVVFNSEIQVNAAVEGTHYREVKGGVVWRKDEGASLVTENDSGTEDVKGEMTQEVKAKVYLELAPSSKLFKAVGPELVLKGGLSFSAGNYFEADIDTGVTDELRAKIALFLSASGRMAMTDLGIPKVAEIAEKLLDVTEFTIIAEKKIPIKEWRINLIGIGEKPPFLEVYGGNRNHRYLETERDRIPLELAAYTMKNAGDKHMDWTVEKIGNLFEYAWIDITPEGRLAPGAAQDLKIVWKNGVSPADLPVGDYGGTLRFVNKTREMYPDFQSGSTERNLELRILRASDAPGGVLIDPRIEQSPDVVPIGTAISQWGGGCTPNGRVSLYVREPGGNEFMAQELPVDSGGRFRASYRPPPGRPGGDYDWWVVDNDTGETSNDLTYTIINEEVPAAPLTIGQSSVSGHVNAGETLEQWGSGATPHGGAFDTETRERP